MVPPQPQPKRNIRVQSLDKSANTVQKLEEENKRLRQKITTELKEKEKVNFLKDLTHEEVYEPFDTEVKKDLPLYLTAIKEQLVKDEPYNS